MKLKQLTDVAIRIRLIAFCQTDTNLQPQLFGSFEDKQKIERAVARTVGVASMMSA